MCQKLDKKVGPRSSLNYTKDIFGQTTDFESSTIAWKSSFKITTYLDAITWRHFIKKSLF